jgi:hypothetical protein
MSQYPELVKKLIDLKAAMLRAVDFTKPYRPILSEVEYIDILCKNILSITNDTGKEMRFGKIGQVSKMARYLYDDIDWHKYPEVDALINDAITLAREIIRVGNL